MSDYNLSQLKVLIADDSKLMRQLVRSLLEVVGISRFAEASDGNKAWDQAVTFNPDLVVTDWNMPPTSGLDFVRRLRMDRLSANPYVPVIMITGYCEEYRVVEARDTGITEFIAKPLTANALYDRLRAVVEDSRQFVKAPGYFGPDRRRGRREAFTGVERRAA